VFYSDVFSLKGSSKLQKSKSDLRSGIIFAEYNTVYRLIKVFSCEFSTAYFILAVLVCIKIEKSYLAAVNCSFVLVYVNLRINPM
jgi:hypothetical protein